MSRGRVAFGVLLVVGAALALSSCELFERLFGDPPAAVLGADPTAGDAPLDVTFDLSGSTAPGGVHRFRLDFGDGSDFATGTELDDPIDHTYVDPGTYTAVLELTNTRGQADHDTEAIVVGEPAEPEEPGPIAVLAADTTIGDAPLIVSFDVSVSSAPDSTLVSFRLDFGDGTPQYVGTNFSQPIIHLYGEVGLHTATLRVTDANGATGIATLDIVATTVGGGSAPIARFEWTPEDPFIDEEVAFDAGASNDPSRGTADPQAIVVYTWDFGDGAEAATTEETVDHTYTWPGTYLVTLTIYDDDGVAGTAEDDITVCGAIAYVSCLFDGSVSQIRLPSNIVSNTIKPFDWATGVAIDPDGSFVYVGGASFILEMAAAAKIRTSNHTVRARADDLDMLPWDVACSPNGNWLYATGGFFFEPEDELLVINTTTMTVVDVVPVQSYPSTIAFSPAGGFAYVAGSDPDSIVRIDTSDHSFAGDVDLSGEGAPWGIAVTSDGQFALVTLPDVGAVLLVDLVEGEVVDEIDLGFGATPVGIALTHDDAFAYVTDPENGCVYVIDMQLGEVLDEILLDDELFGLAWPWGIAISPGDSVAVVPFGISDELFEAWWLGGEIPFVPAMPVFIIDLATNEVIDMILTGFGPMFVDIWGIGY